MEHGSCQQKALSKCLLKQINRVLGLKRLSLGQELVTAVTCVSYSVQTSGAFCTLVTAVPHGAYPGVLVRALDSDHPRNGLERTLG